MKTIIELVYGMRLKADSSFQCPVQFGSLAASLLLVVMPKATEEDILGCNFLRAFGTSITCSDRTASCAAKLNTGETQCHTIKIIANERSPRIVNKNDKKRNTNAINVTESNTSLNYESKMCVTNNRVTDPKDMAGTKCSMMPQCYEDLSTSPKRNRRKPSKKNGGVLSMNKPGKKVVDHVPLSRVIKASSQKRVDNGAFSSFTRKGQKDTILMSTKLHASFNSESKRKR